MHTLLLRLVAPLQSWGINSNFDIRRTERAPTKSAIIGMLGAALGSARNADSHQKLSAALRFGVRVDKEGEFIEDFHIAKSENDSYVTFRHYLSDAKFLVGLEGEKSLLEELDKALNYPYFQIYLGRRSCPPEGRVNLGIRLDRSLEESLNNEPLLHEYREYQRPDSLRLLIEPLPNESERYYQKDDVVSFSKDHRAHNFRPVQEKHYYLDHNYVTYSAAIRDTEHNPLESLQAEEGQ